MSARKLQQEFDKTNKKIAEGLSVFDDIYDKLMTSEIASQKEKLESDLKKEIKKLQRSRDQLKQWLGDGSIKLDKNLLQDNRTRIEHAMDQFKDLEKSSKIKQFSNEGLELQSQKSKYSKFNDPADAKKNEACEYLGDIIDQISQQNESIELEVHSLTVQLKKSKSSLASIIQTSLDDLKYKLERNGHHLTQLEKVMRSIENEKLDPERIDDIKDDLEYYVEMNQEEDYVEYDDFYEQLEVEDDFDYTQDGEEEEETEEKEEVEEKEVKEEKKEEKKKEVKVEKPKKETNGVKPTLASTAAAVGGALNAGLTAAKKKVVPAPPPANYSTIIKAAQEAKAATTNAAATLASAVSAPPGLPEKVKSQSISPKPQPHTQIQPQSQSQLPETKYEQRTLWDTIPRLSMLPQSRLHNPLPFQNISQLLESSLLNCPDSFDAEKPRQYNPKNVHPSSIDYPQEPMYELNSSHIMEKFDIDTLFFCFYYSEGSDNIARWNAAKELSKRGWVLNNETKQWFAKDKKATPLDGDADNYKYFDYERTWLIRRRDNIVLASDATESFR